jgi:hypothetical protein
MARLVFSHSKIVLSLWGGVSLGITDQNLLETLHGLLKVIQIEFGFSFAKDELGSKILWR